MSVDVKLSARMDTAGAVALEARLNGSDELVIDAAEVDMMGGLCLEVLSEAILRRIEAGADIRITNPSDGFQTALKTFGLDTETFNSGGFPQ